MSDYQHERVIRCKVDLKKLGIEDIFDLEDYIQIYLDMELLINLMLHQLKN